MISLVKKIGEDLDTLLAEANANLETRKYLNSYSVIIGDIVYARRMQLNLSQEELGKQAETTKKRISMIEAAKGNVDQDILDRVFNVLKLIDLFPVFDEQSATRA